MKELNFSININLSLTLKEDEAHINIKDVDLIPAVVSLPYRLTSRDRPDSSKTEKKTVHDIILQTAKKYVIDTGQNKFTGAKLFNLSLLDHPKLKRNTFAAQVIAAAPTHPSHRHYPNQKDYFTYLGKGNYKLNQKYLEITEEQMLPPSDRVRQYVKSKYIGAAQLIDAKTLKLSVWERPDALTTACGTGACVAVAAAHRRGLTDVNRMAVIMPAGSVEIELKGDDSLLHCWETGPWRTPT